VAGKNERQGWLHHCHDVDHNTHATHFRDNTRRSGTSVCPFLSRRLPLHLLLLQTSMYLSSTTRTAADLAMSHFAPVATVFFCLDWISALSITKMIENEKQQVKDFRSQGYSDRQLQEIGFCEASIRRAPSVAMAK